MRPNEPSPVCAFLRLASSNPAAFRGPAGERSGAVDAALRQSGAGRPESDPPDWTAAPFVEPLNLRPLGAENNERPFG